MMGLMGYASDMCNYPERSAFTADTLTTYKRLQCVLRNLGYEDYVKHVPDVLAEMKRITGPDAPRDSEDPSVAWIAEIKNDPNFAHKIICRANKAPVEKTDALFVVVDKVSRSVFVDRNRTAQPSIATMPARTVADKGFSGKKKSTKKTKRRRKIAER